MISNAFKQFPDLNVLYLKLTLSRFVSYYLKCYEFCKFPINIIVVPL